MTDEELVRAFEACDTGLGGLSHENHLRVAWWYLRRESLGFAAERFKAGLRRFAESRGKPGLYHETITWGYLVLLGEKLDALGAAAAFEDVKRGWPELLDHTAGELRRVYREEELKSLEARRVFRLPRGGAR